MISFKTPVKFEWYKGNSFKNWDKHNVTKTKAEEVFYYKKKRIIKDILNSKNEERFLLIGKTKNERALFIVFTIRDKRVRIISARDLNKREKHLLKGE